MEPNPIQPEPDHEDEAAVQRLRAARTTLRAEIAKAVVGQDVVIDAMLTRLALPGPRPEVLGVPGFLGKTLMAKTLARSLQMEYSRIQFTPDLMPADITGTDIIEEDLATGHRRLEFHQGPLFTNFLLADENCNRASPPKTQSLLAPGDAGDRGLGRPAALPARTPVLRRRHPEPDRAGGDVPRSPERSSTASCSTSPWSTRRPTRKSRSSRGRPRRPSRGSSRCSKGGRSSGSRRSCGVCRWPTRSCVTP